MCDCCTISWWLMGWRALHFLACLLPLGLLAFHLLVAAPVLREYAGPSRATMLVILLSLLVALVSGIGWLLMIAGNIGDLAPIQALRSGMVTTVLKQTQFGAAWRWRSVFWGVAITLSSLMVLRRRTSTVLAWICLAATVGLLGGLAWAGHGLDGNGEGGAARFHVIADMVHLVTAGVWPFGLAPFAVALVTLQRRNDPSGWAMAAALTRRFSAVALICVALLTATGLVNSCFMLPSFPSLWQSGYGRLLSLKIAVFAPMIVFAGINRLSLKPRVSTGQDAPAMNSLRRNVIIEFALGTAIILIVALLGLCCPPMP